jgi:hypothetical protein
MTRRWATAHVARVFAAGRGAYGCRRVAAQLNREGTINREDWGLTWNMPLAQGGLRLVLPLHQRVLVLPNTLGRACVAAVMGSYPGSVAADSAVAPSPVWPGGEEDFHTVVSLTGHERWAGQEQVECGMGEVLGDRPG